MASFTYLHIRGRLSENMVYTPRPGHESARPERRGEGDPAFNLVLLDRGGHALVSVHPRVIPSGCGSARDAHWFRVRGSLPLHPDGVAYQLRRGESTLYKALIPPEPPKISARSCRLQKEEVTLRWRAAGQKGVTYTVLALMESGRRFAIARGLTKPFYSVDINRIPASGKAKLLIMAGDGVRSAEVEAGSIDVPLRQPMIHIITPAAESVLPFGYPLSVLGCCLDVGGAPCSAELAEWWIDGERFASGSWIAALDAPQAGDHVLTLKYGGEEDGVQTSVRLAIKEPDSDYRRWEELVTGGNLTSAEPTGP